LKIEEKKTAKYKRENEKKRECGDEGREYFGLLKQIMCIHKKILHLREKNKLLYYSTEIR
jgi:hypothetical protein